MAAALCRAICRRYTSRTLLNRPFSSSYFTSDSKSDSRSDSDSPVMISSSNEDDGPSTEIISWIPGLDHKHWLVFVQKQIMPSGKNVEKSDVIDFYVKTLSKIFWSNKEIDQKKKNSNKEPTPKEQAKQAHYEVQAKKLMYSVSYQNYFAFGCEIDEKTAHKLLDFAEVKCVIPDSYVDVENKDYGGVPYINGEIIERSPEKQKRVEECPEELRRTPKTN